MSQRDISSAYGVVEGNESQSQTTKRTSLMERLRALYKEKVKTDSQIIQSQKQQKQQTADSDVEEDCCEETVKEYQEEEKRLQRKIKMNKKRKLKERFQDDGRRESLIQEYYGKDQLGNDRNGKRKMKKNNNKKVKVEVDTILGDQAPNGETGQLGQGKGQQPQEITQSQNLLIIKTGKVRNIMSLIEEYGEQKESVKAPNIQEDTHQLNERFQENITENCLSNETNFDILHSIKDLKYQKKDYLNKQPGISNLLSCNIDGELELRDSYLENEESNDYYDNNNNIFEDYCCATEQFSSSKNTDDKRQFVRDQMKYKERKHDYNNWMEHCSQISKKANTKEIGYSKRRRQQNINRDNTNDGIKGDNKRKVDLKQNCCEDQGNGSDGLREKKLQELIEKEGTHKKQSSNVIVSTMNKEQAAGSMKKLSSLDDEEGKNEMQQKRETKVDNVNLDRGNQQKQVQLQQYQTQDNLIKGQQDLDARVDRKLSQQCKILHRRRINKLIPTNVQATNSHFNETAIGWNTNSSCQDWDKDTLKQNNHPSKKEVNQVGILIYERSNKSRKESKNISNYLQQAAKYRAQRGIANTISSHRIRNGNMLNVNNPGQQQQQGDLLLQEEKILRKKQKDEQEEEVCNDMESSRFVEEPKEDKQTKAKRFAFNTKSNYLNSLRQNKDLIDRKKNMSVKQENSKNDANIILDIRSMGIDKAVEVLQKKQEQKQKSLKQKQSDTRSLSPTQLTFTMKKEDIVTSLDINKNRVPQLKQEHYAFTLQPNSQKQYLQPTKETHQMAEILQNDELVGDIELDVPIVDYRHQFNPLTNNTLFIAKIATLGTTLEMLPDGFQNRNGNIKLEANLHNMNGVKIEDINNGVNLENTNKPMFSRKEFLKRSRQRVTDIKSAKTTLEEIVMRFQKTELQEIGSVDQEAMQEEVLEEGNGGRIQELEEQEDIEKETKYQRLLALEEGIEEEQNIKLIENELMENADELERGDLELLLESELHREQDKELIQDESQESNQQLKESEQMSELPAQPEALMLQHPRRLMSKYDKKIFNERVAKEQRRAARRQRAEKLLAERQEKEKHRNFSGFIEDQADEAEGDEEEENENIIDQKKTVNNDSEEEGDSEDDLDAELQQWIDDAQVITNYDCEDDDYNKQILVRQKYFEQEFVDDKKNLKQVIYSVKNNSYKLRDQGEGQKQLKNQGFMVQKQAMRDAALLELKDQDEPYGCYEDQGEGDSEMNQKGKNKRRNRGYYSQFEAPKCPDMVIQQFSQKRLNTTVAAAAKYSCNRNKKNNSFQANLRKQQNLRKLVLPRSSLQINDGLEMKIVDDEIMSLVKELDKENQHVFSTIGSQKQNKLMKNLGFGQNQQAERKLFTELMPQKLHRSFSQKIFASFM